MSLKLFNVIILNLINSSLPLFNIMFVCHLFEHIVYSNYTEGNRDFKFSFVAFYHLVKLSGKRIHMLSFNFAVVIFIFGKCMLDPLFMLTFALVHLCLHLRKSKVN